MKVIAITYGVALALAIGLAVVLHSRFNAPPPADTATAEPATVAAGADLDVRRIELQLVPRLAARSKHQLHIGTPDCSRPTNSDVYYRICYLPVDGTEVPVGLRYDTAERIIPHLLWALVDANRAQRNAANLARFEYDMGATATCPGPRWRVLPPGIRFACFLQTQDGGQHTVQVVIRSGAFGPYPSFDSIPGLRLDPQVAAVYARIASQLRADRTISGAAVIRLYDVVALRSLNAMAPEARAGKMFCPRTLSPGDLNAFCTIESKFGYIRLGIEADDNYRIHFYPLSLPTNMRVAERTGKKRIEAAYRRKGVSVIAHVDCGDRQWVALSLPSVHYCTVALSNGQQSRMGVEYYDEIEGIHLSFEPLASGSALQ